MRNLRGSNPNTDLQIMEALPLLYKLDALRCISLLRVISYVKKIGSSSCI